MNVTDWHIPVFALHTTCDASSTSLSGSVTDASRVVADATSSSTIYTRNLTDISDPGKLNDFYFYIFFTEPSPCPLRVATQKGRLELKFPLSRMSSAVEIRDIDDVVDAKRGMNRLHIAAEEGDIPEMKRLLDAGANLEAVVIDTTNTNHTALNWAVNWPEAMLFLLERGADYKKGSMICHFSVTIPADTKNEPVIRWLFDHGWKAPYNPCHKHSIDKWLKHAQQ